MEQPSTSPRTRRTRQQIADLLAEYNSSDMTVKEFCQSHHISSERFHKWQAMHKDQGTKQSTHSGFAALQVSSSSPGLFAEVKGIRIYQPVSASYLKELLS